MLPWRSSDSRRSTLWPTKREKGRDKQRQSSTKPTTPPDSERATSGRGSRYSRDTIADNEDYDGDNSGDELDDDDEGMSSGSGKIPRLLPTPPSPPYRPNGKSLSKFASSHQRAVLDLRDRKDQILLDHNDRMEELDQRRHDNEQAAMQRIEEWKADLRGAGVNEPHWPSDAHHQTSSLTDLPSRHTRPATLESSTDKPAFLYNNLTDAGLELKVRALLLRVSVAIRNGNLSKADTLVTDALSVAAKLDYPPIVGKCRYWEAVLRDSQGRRQDAARAIVLAQPCVGKYIEGEEAVKWWHNYRSVIAELELE